VFLYIQRNKFLLSGCRYKPVTAPGVAANQKFVSRLQFLSFYTLWAINGRDDRTNFVGTMKWATIRPKLAELAKTIKSKFKKG
jgi:hypothetical protein